jgi:hypothetical protein
MLRLVRNVTDRESVGSIYGFRAQKNHNGRHQPSRELGPLGHLGH